MSAISALKGYRTQFLYSLYRILNDYEKGYLFKVEGEYEDLDILNSSNKYVESIQVKNKGKTLSFSDMFSAKDSFFKRADKLISKNPNVKIKIVSFNVVSDELINKEKLTKKLQRKGFNIVKIDRILNNYCQPEVIDETELFKKTLEIIKSHNIFSNPKIALELLLFWIYKSGENQKEITTKNLIEDLNKIGKFLSEQDAFQKQYGNSIIPLSAKTIDNEDINLLQKGFYYGISAKYEHILANLDVIRTEKLSVINTAFKKTNIFFIHGASGQGKSTLAYRYLHNYLDDNTVYELKVSDRLHEVFETINSLDALSKGLKFRITLYIDVSPENSYWNEVLKELSTKSNLNFLITIRQEDWNRTTLGEDFDFDDFELKFNKSEAEIIYKSLSEYKVDLKFTDFEESWLQLGTKGMLLEYVFLLNQGDKLKNRLQNQVQRLEKEKRIEELEILRFVCLCDSYNSKINFINLIKYLNIHVGISSSYIKLLENEYLLKFDEDKKYLTGLHPIRSKLLGDILFLDNDYVDINEYINRSIALIDEKDLHIFLLNSFENSYKVDDLIRVLDSLEIRSFLGYNNVFNALLWKGISDFIFIKNKNIFDTLYKDYVGFWNLLLPYDYSEVIGKSFHEQFKEHISEDINKEIENLQSSFTPKNDIYEYVEKWLLQKNEIYAECFNEIDISALGRFLFWLGHLKLNNNIKVGFIEDDVLHLIKSKNFSLKSISELILGLNYYASHKDLLFDLKTFALSNLRTNHSIINLNAQEDISCTYFYNVIEYETNSEQEQNILNKKSMEIIDLLRNIFPFKNKYGVVGKGKTFFGINMPYDPTEKNIERKNIPIPYLVQINVLIQNLFSYQHRHDNWSDYVKAIESKRKKYNEISSLLVKSFASYFRSSNYKVFVDVISKIETDLKKIRTVPLPKNVSDKWGYISEGKARNSIMDNQEELHRDHSNKSVSLRKYEPFKKSQRDYFSSLESFLNQIGENILTLYKIRTGIEEFENYNSGGISNNIKKALLSHYEYSSNFESHFKKFFNKSKLKKLDSIEGENLIALFYCWKQILNQKGNINNKVLKNANKMFSETKTNLTKRLKKERQKIFEDFGFSFTVEVNGSNGKLGNRLLLTCDVDAESYMMSWIVARMLIANSLNSDYFSFKRIIIESNIESVIFIPLIEDNALNQNAVEIHLHNLDEEIDEDNILFQVNPFFRIDKNIVEHLDLSFWNEIIFEIKDYESIMAEVSNIKELSNQIESLEMEEKDDVGKSILSEYIKEVEMFLQGRINNSFKSLVNIKEYLDEDMYETIHHLFSNFSFKTLDYDGFDSLQSQLSENYYYFAESLIEKNLLFDG